MKEKNYEEMRDRQFLQHEIYRLRMIERKKIGEIASQFGINVRTVYRSIAIFAEENPEEAALIKRQTKEIPSEERKELLQEIAKLKQDLAQQRLRADFYEEMVDYGKEVYGIDLKKAGTK